MPRRPKYPCIACARGLGRSRRCRRCGALQRIRDYEVEAVLATGPRGRVYRARSPAGVVVLKELAFATVPDLQTLERFGREAEVLSRLDHPRIPRCLEFFSDGEAAQLRLYLAQQHLAGENLEQRLAHHTFDEAEAAHLAAELLELLVYLHGRSPRIVHRDIKPSNLISLGGGRVALVDFGAVRLGQGQGQGGLDRCSIAGTFGYMPPEQLSREADERSDLYALGMTLCRLLSRRKPEELLGPGLEVRFREHVHVSPQFAEFLSTLVARDPSKRFATAVQARDSLTSSRTTSRIPAPPQVDAASPLAPAPSAPPVEWHMSFGSQRILLRPGCSYLVGRSSHCDIVIDDAQLKSETVSRRHVRLRVTPAGLEVEDLGSLNGTLVGEERLLTTDARVTLQDGAHLELGSFWCSVQPAFAALDASPAPLRRRARARVQWGRAQLLGYLGGDPEGVRIAYLDRRIPSAP